MKTRSPLCFRPGGAGRAGHAPAFSLIEIMITVGLLSFIVLGLLAMFDQTQRAFRAGVTQSDILETGRSTMDILSRELEQMAPSHHPDLILGGGRYRAMNFFVEPSPLFPNPLRQELTGSTQPRTNMVQRFYFLTRANQDWIGTGYQVIPDDANGWVGSLYRLTATNYPRSRPLSYPFPDPHSGQPTLSAMFQPGTYPWTSNRIADGVVHLRLRAYATNGYLITTNWFLGTNTFALSPRGPYTNVANTVACVNWQDPDQSACYFMSNALPAYVELELGILEPRTLQKYRGIPANTAAAQLYLSNHAAQVHIFRQRIPVRNVDFSAYP